MTRAFDSSSGSKSFVNIILLAVSIFIAGCGGFGIFWLCRRDKKFAPAYLAGMFGVYVGFFIYKWTFQLFWDNTLVLLILAAGFALTLGGYAYVHAFTLILPITSCIGSLMLLRGISVLIGAFSSQTGSFTMSSVVVTGFFYLMAFILLFAAGYSFQKSRGYDSENQDDKEDQGSLEGDADE